MSWCMRVVLSIVAIAFAAPVFAEGARAWLDRDSMQLGETVTLNVEVEGGAAGEPDFSALAADFTLLGTQSSRQFNMTNGQSTSKNVWAIGLEPKREGTLEIPPITVGTLRTSALRLAVHPAAVGAQGKAGDAVYVEASAEPLDPYVQQQVKYVVKLFYAVDLTEGSLEEPSADGIVVSKLGRDRQYVATVGERRYRVLERHYALVPERSGTLALPALAFRGSALDGSDPTGFFRRGRALSARSEPIELEVRAKPAQWGAAPWLPAASLELADEGTIPGEVAVGEPVTRTVRIRGQGLGYEQLPEITMDAPAGSELYPDKADTQTRDDGSWLYGERTRKFAFVPTRPGTLVLPSLEVAWWDTVNDRRVTAVLPAHEIKVVAPGAGAAPTAGEPPSTAPVVAPVTVAWPAESDGSALRLWRATALVALASWALTLYAWWRSRAARAPSRATATVAVPDRAAFRRACATGDLAGAERALLGWARQARPALRNLGELADALADDVQRATIAALQRVRYAGDAAAGLATRLDEAFRAGFAWRGTPTAVDSTSPLPPLYPER